MLSRVDDGIAQIEARVFDPRANQRSAFERVWCLRWIERRKIGASPLLRVAEDAEGAEILGVVGAALDAWFYVIDGQEPTPAATRASEVVPFPDAPSDSWRDVLDVADVLRHCLGIVSVPTQPCQVR